MSYYEVNLDGPRKYTKIGGGRRQKVSRDYVQKAMQSGGGAMYDFNPRDPNYKAKVLMWPNMWSPSDIGKPDCGTPTYTVVENTPVEAIISTAVATPSVTPPQVKHTYRQVEKQKPLQEPSEPKVVEQLPPELPEMKSVSGVAPLPLPQRSAPHPLPPTREKVSVYLKNLVDRGRGQYKSDFDKLDEFINIVRENTTSIHGTISKATGEAESIQKPGTLTKLPARLENSFQEYDITDRGKLYQYSVAKDNSYFRAILAAGSPQNGKNAYISQDTKSKNLILEDFMNQLKKVMNLEIELGTKAKPFKTSFKKVIAEIIGKEPGQLSSINPQALANGLLGAVLKVNIILLQWRGSSPYFTCDYTFIEKHHPYIVITLNQTDGYYQPVFKAIYGGMQPNTTLVVRTYLIKGSLGYTPQGSKLIPALNTWANRVCNNPINFMTDTDQRYQLGGNDYEEVSVDTYMDSDSDSDSDSGEDSDVISEFDPEVMESITTIMGGGAMFDGHPRDQKYASKTLSVPNMWSPSDVDKPDCGTPSYEVIDNTEGGGRKGKGKKSPKRRKGKKHKSPKRRK